MSLLLCFAMIVSLGAAFGQQSSSEQGRGEQAPSGSRREKSPAYVPRRGYGIVADNLDRVAATAEQILEVVNRDAGLMVELKRAIAQEAGESGQLLEESDLSEGAVTERLHEDLRTRVLATRLLQRYGYLLPKVNPDSDLAAEHNLTMRARAQQMEQAAGSHDSPHAAPQTVIEVGTQPSTEHPSDQGRPAREPLVSVDGTFDTSRPEMLAAPPEAHLDLVKAGGRPSMQSESAERAVNALPAETPMTTGEVPIAPAPRPSRAEGTSAAEFEPVRMDRRPNPYADVPSLYDLYVQANSPNRKAERFGLDVFRNSTAAPDILPMDLPVGPDYVVGPGDSLSINLWGGVSERLLRTVDREGRLALPEAGPLLVSGKSLGEVQDSVQRVLRTQFRDVSADVSLLRLRTVRVYVVGEVSSPGAYDISSLSTPLNALLAAGGVTARGSLRRLEHYRGKQLLEEVDAYDLLLHGIRGDMKRLENGDSLRVPPLGSSVTVDGMVRRPAIYELRSEKNLNEVLDLAGGILPAAALRHIEVQRLEAHEKRTMLSLDVGEASDKDALRATFEQFKIQDGDEIHIFPIAPYNSGAVYLEGHVLRPGRYSFREGMKLTDLISSYKDLLPEPSERYAEIIRITAPDNRPVVESFNLGAALDHPESAPKLQPLDTVRIFGRYDLEAVPEIMVGGEVRAPGRYRVSGQEHLRDAIYQAGGVTPETWLDSAQLFRAMPDATTKVFSISLREALAGDPLNNILIEPRDRILMHRQPERVSPPSVSVRGEVVRPGRYPLTSNMQVSDLVRSAGGLLRSANPEAGDITHYAILSNSSGDRLPSGHQDVNLAAALAGKEDQNLPLRDGDELTVPQQAGWNDIGATVTLRGEVRKPGVYGIQPGERLSSLLRRAGGLLPTAYPRAAVFERTEVRELQQKSRQDLIQRLEQESAVVKTSASTTATEEVALQQAAVQQRQRALDALRRAPISGRLVIHLRADRKDFAGSPDDIELRTGDSLTIPKQPGVVLVIGQVYNANALTYTPGRNAGWYLSRAGGPTQLADKGGIFIIRSDGSVTGGKQGSFWSGSVLSATLGPGDTVVVPEKPVLGSSTLKNVLSVAQIASSAALVAAVAIP
ncbi:MAG TPA: SLBB domain-containing protein [Terriglobales bacterium]|nr:SLBB domain-containing protein [Terriglobales bacterium]